MQAMSAGGKATFYIVPLQETLDTSPLPPDSHCFAKMPKKTCFQCHEVMPLQMLAVHIRTCSGKLSSDETVAESSDELCIVENACKRTIVQVQLLNLQYANQKARKMYCAYLNTKLTSQQSFKLCDDREGLPDRGILQWKRKKAASPASALKVVYIGEAGIDTGAIRKEFLTDMVSGIKNRFFEGAGNQGKNPKYS
ncbi:hypothetical protein F7725_026934 [Dissostichus mawsoni]|uniref:HECT domain-containing protein n=1 Tax=Dissostichus mawsoni TaxID=36200 RepID=A0A7J5X9D1_DISMA|nr:hypothetical protein F7725_026934 [Dissostichus mawsoni]